MGDSKLVKVTSLGGRVQEFSLADGETAEQLLSKHGINTEGHDVRVSGGKSAKTPLSHGDVITLVKEVRGGTRS